MPNEQRSKSHVVPSVAREHACISPALVPGPQAPLAQTNGVQVRVCVPPVEHVVANPAHALHAVQLEVPHVVPVVERMQDCESIRGEAAHPPPAHAKSMHVLDCVPLVAHVLAKPPHVPNAPQVVAPQLVPVVERVHAWFSTRIAAPQTPLPQTRSVHVRD